MNRTVNKLMRVRTLRRLLSALTIAGRASEFSFEMKLPSSG